jgi:hypothetical protein
MPDPRSPLRPGRPFAPTRPASAEPEVDVTPTAGSYWSGHFPQPEHDALSYWGGHFPEGIPDAGFGPAGAGTFQLSLESGTQVTYQWQTSVIKSRSGLERRTARLDRPRQVYQGPAILLGDDSRIARARLARYAALGVTFVIGLPYEDLSIAAEPTTAEFELPASAGPGLGTVTHWTIYVHSTALCDWALVGQRVVLQNPGTSEAATASIVSFTSTSITIDSDPGEAGGVGSRIMPGMASYLDPQQGFARYPVSAERWQVNARAALFGFADTEDDVPEVGVGATVATFAGRPVWDCGIDVEGTAPDSLQSMHTVEDPGGVPFAVGAAKVPDWGRALSYTRALRADWQWLKRFLDTVKGKFKSFWLPTWRADLVAVSTGTGTLTITAGEGAGDVFVWWPEHRTHIQIRQANGTITWARISAAVDNGDETVTLDIVDENDAAITLSGSAVSLVSWFELCRLESDDVVVAFDGNKFSMQAQARVVQQ